MSDLGLSGLASGVDTSGIIDKLMAIDRQAVTKIQNKQTSTTAHQAALRAVAVKLTALQNAAGALTDSASWKATQSAVSSDDSKVSVAMLAGSGIGGHTVQVDRLASSAQHGYTFAPNAAAGSLTLYYGSDPAAAGASKTTISVAANASAKDVATAINATDASPVYAAVVTDADGSDRLVLSARKSGQSSDFTVDASGLASGQLTADPAYARTGATLNASYKIDGEATARSSESNSIDNAVAGLRLSLKGVTTSPASVTTTEATIDKAGIKTKVQAFVDAYNAVVDLTRGDVAEKKVVGSTATADLQKGTLFGDLGLDGMLSSLRNTLTQTLSSVGSYTSLSDIGISLPKSTGAGTSDDAKAGKLTFDATKLDTALNTDYTQVQKLFNGVGAHKGFGYLVSDFVNKQNGLKGVLTGRINSDTKSLDDLTKQTTATNDRLSATEARLKAQFAAMETALQNAQSQQQWLTGQINSLG